jgi:hypothetical protein
MPILNDAGAAACPRDLITERLAREHITMTSLLTGQARPTTSPSADPRRTYGSS